jgi:hypothetical protein
VAEEGTTLMWEALAKIATFGTLIIQRLWPAAKKDEPTADPVSIATAQSSGYTADREGKIASARAKK